MVDRDSAPDPVAMADDDPRLVAAAAMRQLGHAMVAFETDAGLLRLIAEQATATAGIIEAGTRRERPVIDIKQKMWSSPPPTGGRMGHFEECVVSGRANPMGVAIVVRRDGDAVEADVHVGAAFEGAPRRAHGGIVAAILDDLMGYVLMVHETPAFTGQLSVRYLAPTPVESDLMARAWLDRREDRKLWLASSLATPEGETIATAEGLFIAVARDRFRNPENPAAEAQ